MDEMQDSSLISIRSTLATHKQSMPKEAWLTYNGLKSIKIDRYKVANSCFYFNRLLDGPFKESRESNIHINLGNMFSFEALDCIVKYADQGIFLRDPDKHDIYIEAIQLAILWAYDEFVEVVEEHFINHITLYNMTDLHGLARRHKFALQRLERACLAFEQKLGQYHSDTMRPWPRCAIDGHGKHSYINCNQKLVPRTIRDDDWEKIVSTTLTEEERSELARLREQRNIGAKRR